MHANIGNTSVQFSTHGARCLPRPIRKAVFPVAGLGTRFLPATKVVPKELLPVVDRPLIQYAVDEAREAGIEQMIFVTGRGKTGIVEHFDIAFELEQTMTERGKDLSVLECTRATPGDVIAARARLWGMSPLRSSCPTS